VADLRALLDLPPQARERLWAVLGPCMTRPALPGLKQEIEAFERAFGLSVSLLPRILRAYSVLVSGAALRGVPIEAFATDLTELTGSEEPGAIVARGYGAAMALVRREALLTLEAACRAMLGRGGEARESSLGEGARRARST
jgi:hypothetical protein